MTYWKDSTLTWADSSDPNYPEIWNTAVGSSPANGAFPWTYANVPTWVQEQMDVNVRATDLAGNMTYSTSTFTFDTIPPVSITTYPALSGLVVSSMSAIAGTVTDSRNVTKVQIRLETNLGRHHQLLDERRLDRDPATPGWMPPAPAAAASPSPGPTTTRPTIKLFTDPSQLNFAWTTGGFYEIQSRGKDQAGNFEVAYRPRARSISIKRRL